MANRSVVPTSGICSPRERPTSRRRSGAPTALLWSHVQGRKGKTKVKMSASTKQNSDKHMSEAQSTGVHQAFTNGYQREPQRGRSYYPFSPATTLPATTLSLQQHSLLACASHLLPRHCPSPQFIMTPFPPLLQNLSCLLLLFVYLKSGIQAHSELHNHSSLLSRLRRRWIPSASTRPNYLSLS